MTPRGQIIERIEAALEKMRLRGQIIERIEAALEKMRLREMSVRAIYLDPEDDAAFVQANTRAWREECGSEATFYATEYQGHDLRQGKTSIIYSTHGVGVAIPKRLSPRVRQAA